MRRPLILLAVLCIAPAGARAVPLPTPFDSNGFACLGPTPGAAHVPVVDPSDIVTLDVRVVLDRGFAQARAAAVLGKMKESYDPLGVAIASAGYTTTSFSGADSQGIINQAKTLFGGARPTGSDVVLVLTPVDISAPGLGNAVVGQADCIGGVRYPDHAFMVSEDLGDADFGLGPVRFDGNLAAKTVGHELGHLLGAHHHYADCAEGWLKETGTTGVEVSPCTIMFNAVDFTSINFGVLEGAFVRGYAEEFARP